MKVLVTGSCGYIGGRLVPALLDAGHDVRAAVSGRSGGPQPWWSDHVETVTMDVLEPEQVAAAVQGVDAVYYLIHGMGGEDFAQTDREAAQHVLDAVAAPGGQRVRRIVYLSGIVPRVDTEELSEHITSRLEVEQILSRATTESPAAPVVVTLRAAVVLGSGSTSFEIIRQISERLPAQTIPTWMNSTVQPIAVVDVVAALVGALTADVPTRHYDVGGPDRLLYADLLDQYAEQVGLHRPQVLVPFLPTDLVGVLAGSLTDVPDQVVRALVQSLGHDMVCAEDDFRTDLLPPRHRLLSLRQAITRSLAPGGSDPATADPMAPLPHDPHWASAGEDRPLGARVVDAVRGILPTSGT